MVPQPRRRAKTESRPWVAEGGRNILIAISGVRFGFLSSVLCVALTVSKLRADNDGVL